MLSPALWHNPRDKISHILFVLKINCGYLSLDLVFSLEHFVNFCEIICSLGDGLRIAFGRVTLLKMGFLSKHTHLYHN